MRTWMFVLLALASVSVLAVEDNYGFNDPEQRVLFLKLTAELRCPMCQNQNIADSDAMIAHDMRRKVYTLLKQGKSEEEIVTYMKDRYGDFVYYKPPVTAATIWLWALPLVFIFVVLFLVMRRPSKAPLPDQGAKLKQAEAMLKQDKS
ncbi:cytochrome c-type biogenesis protein [Alteromonas confluentis]|uniref:Cytochrome c-type biogenesis protein n=1 Tax=Alteromonas confluentis TaxID=1656094 RepID=A0A1E7Z680_9ALTE|nr:cytochrome c-type biogenesis protein [Alteromonas confluentis]OFC69036.1 cytochrome C biogenesis protein [Alteromonas confluentis]